MSPFIFQIPFFLLNFQDRPAFCAALHELERQHGLKFVPDKLPKGSMLLEVRDTPCVGSQSRQCRPEGRTEH